MSSILADELLRIQEKAVQKGSIDPTDPITAGVLEELVTKYPQEMEDVLDQLDIHPEFRHVAEEFMERAI